MRDHREHGNAGWLVVAVLFGILAVLSLGAGIWELSIGSQLSGTFGFGSIFTGAARLEFVLGVLFIAVTIAAAFEHARSGA